MSRFFKHTNWILFSSISFLFAIVWAGAFIHSSPNKYQPIDNGMYSYTAVVDKIISQKKGYTRCYIQIIAIKDTNISKPYRLISNVYSDDILPADTIYAQTYIKQLNTASNKGQFDLSQYYGYKYVYQTTNISSEKMIKSTYEGIFNFQRWCFVAALWCKEVYEKYIPERSAITMQALLLGIKNDISDDMMEVYMNTGVMHVLAVSGMHVGILYLGMMVLLQRLYKRWSYITLIPIFMVWVFSFITGGGPAILRAAIMITFVDIGKKMDADSHSVNLLFVSGFFLLIFQPYLVWDIGFQLSFAAMLGLFYFMPPLQNLLLVKRGWVKNYIWDPSVMSVSAQLVTTPLTFFYFGNFPIFFLLTNLLILIPITIALYAGVFLFLTSVLLPDVFNLYLGKLIDLIVYYGFDALLDWMSKLPGAYTNQIYLSFWQVICLCFAIFFLGFWLYHIKNAKWLLYSIGLCLVTVVGSFIRQIQLKSHSSITVFHVPNTTAVGVDNYLWTPQDMNVSVVENNGFSLQGYLREKGWKKWLYTSPENVKSDSISLVAGNTSVLFLNQPLNQFYSKYPIEIDYLILGKDLFLNIDQLKDNFKFQTLVLDGSLDYSKYGLFKKMLNDANISYWDTREKGALEISL